jgi:hypothetical protein
VNSVYSCFIDLSSIPEPFIQPLNLEFNKITESMIIKDLEFGINEKLLSPNKPLYEFNDTKALKILTTLANRRGRIFAFEKMFMCFPEYLTIYFNNCDIIMNQTNHLPLTYRYYIAIMVNLIYSRPHLP